MKALDDKANVCSKAEMICARGEIVLAAAPSEAHCCHVKALFSKGEGLPYCEWGVGGRLEAVI
jgi:hypothetical protein